MVEEGAVKPVRLALSQLNVLLVGFSEGWLALGERKSCWVHAFTASTANLRNTWVAWAQFLTQSRALNSTLLGSLKLAHLLT
jgi:hypothetical protein